VTSPGDPGEGEFKGRSRVDVVVLDVDREEGDRTGSLGHVREAVALLEGSSPGVEGGRGQAMTPAEGAHGQAAALPTFENLTPVLLLTGIAGFAL
jgi:hypothetical protein